MMFKNKKKCKNNCFIQVGDDDCYLELLCPTERTDHKTLPQQYFNRVMGTAMYVENWMKIPENTHKNIL